MGKQNLALFEQTMKMFSPFQPPSGERAKESGEKAPAETPPSEDSLSELKDRINDLQQQIEAFRKKEPDQS